MEEKKVLYRIFLNCDLIDAKQTEEEAVQFVEDNFKAEFVGKGSDGSIYQTKNFILAIAPREI